MKLNIKIIFNALRGNIMMTVNVIIILLVLGLGYLIYQNLYLTIINPKPIESSELLIHKEKINEELFDQIETGLDQRGKNLRYLGGSKDPFSP